MLINHATKKAGEVYTNYKIAGSQKSCRGK